MNNDLISREALKKVITANHYLLSAKNNSTDYGMFTTGIMEAIDNAPTVEPQKVEIIPYEVTEKVIEKIALCADTIKNIDWDKAIEAYKARPHGEWLYIDNEWGTFQCDQCKKHSSINFYFCPNCGADMRGGEDGK